MAKRTSVAVITTVLALIICSGVFVGCNKTLKITDFDGLNDLPQNPAKMVFITNLKNVDENGTYGEVIEYAIPSKNIPGVMEKLLAVRYKSVDKNKRIDVSPIINTLTLYDTEGAVWTVQLGLRRHEGRWYTPVNDDALISLLKELIK